MTKLTILDLFSGIGGFSYGLESTGGFTTTAFCEILPYCQKVLKKHWPDVPIHSDIKETDFEHYRGTIDVITGGYPCQPFSLAGKQGGEKDPRHLWPRMREIIEQVRPSWVICENVYGHVKLGLDTVLLDLENLGYTTRTFIVPASGVNAPHKRDRLWIIAYSTVEGLQNRKRSRGRQNETENKTRLGDGLERCGENVTNSNSTGRREGNEEVANRTPEQLNGPRIQPGQITTDSSTSRLSRSTLQSFPRLPNISVEFERSGETIGIVCHTTKSIICGVTNGFPGRVDRIKSLGNSVVPQIVFNIGKAILHAESKKS